MDCPHEHDLAVLSEVIRRQDSVMAVMIWRLGGQVSMTYDEIQHVEKTYETERNAKVTEKEGNFYFRLKAR